MDLQAPLSNLSATQKDQLMTEVKQQIAVANAQELVTVSIYIETVKCNTSRDKIYDANLILCPI